MSRQEFAPKQSEVRITDLTGGLGEFKPKAEKPISLPALEVTLKKAGYKLEEATVTARGVVEQEAGTWRLRIPESGQRFELRGFANLKEGSSATIQGRWTSAAAPAGPPGQAPTKGAVDALTAKDAR